MDSHQMKGMVGQKWRVVRPGKNSITEVEIASATENTVLLRWNHPDLGAFGLQFDPIEKRYAITDVRFIEEINATTK